MVRGPAGAAAEAASPLLTAENRSEGRHGTPGREATFSYQKRPAGTRWAGRSPEVDCTLGITGSEPEPKFSPKGTEHCLLRAKGCEEQ